MALDFLENIIKENAPIDEYLLKQYHSMLFEKIDYMEIAVGGETQRFRIEPGVYKKQDNHVVRLDGKIHQFTDWLHVSEGIEKLFLELDEQKKTLHPLKRAAIFHHKLVSIHSFIDGNGRVARLLMNTILMQAGYTPAIIPVEEKKRYLEALQSADDGNYELLLNLLEEFVNKSLRLTIDVIEGREVFDFDDLARMVRNLAEQSRTIELELGPATVPPEQRAKETAVKITGIVGKLLADHSGKATTPEIRVQFKNQAPLTSSTAVQNFRNQFPSTDGILEIEISGGKRFVPRLAITFVQASNRSQVAVASFARISHFNEYLQEMAPAELPSRQLTGSIYFEDWDANEISTFVLQKLKDAYKNWTAEMDGRKALIVAQEQEVSKFRRQR